MGSEFIAYSMLGVRSTTWQSMRLVLAVALAAPQWVLRCVLKADVRDQHMKGRCEDTVYYPEASHGKRY